MPSCSETQNFRYSSSLCYFNFFWCESINLVNMNLAKRKSRQASAEDGLIAVLFNMLVSELSWYGYSLLRLGDSFGTTGRSQCVAIGFVISHLSDTSMVPCDRRERDVAGWKTETVHRHMPIHRIIDAQVTNDHSSKIVLRLFKSMLLFSISSCTYSRGRENKKCKQWYGAAHCIIFNVIFKDKSGLLLLTTIYYQACGNSA